MNEATFLERLTLLAKLDTFEEADALAGAALEGLGRALGADAARDAAGFLPPGLAARLLAAEHGTIGDLGALADQVAAATGASDVQVRDRLPAVLAMVAEALAEGPAAALAEALPADIARHLAPSAALPGPHPPVAGASARARGLAGARPGMTRPLSEGRPAQVHSVARSDDPHGDTRLAASPGTSQEREGSTLADGRPDRGDPVPHPGERR